MAICPIFKIFPYDTLFLLLPFYPFLIQGIAELQAFTAIGQVTGDTIYQFDMGGGFIPYRRDVKYFECLEVPIQLLVPFLTFIQDKKSWGYLFRFGFFEIPKIDFDLIANQMLLEKEIDG